MLNRLFVKNYALILELELTFDKGLTIITGETGAGKSIILGALGLILGNRADTTALLDKEEKCVVEGHFTMANNYLEKFFSDNDIDFLPQAVMRREIGVNGRSRAFINDTPVTLDLMKELGAKFIDIHSQHETLMLGDNSFQIGLLDSFAGHKGILEEYSREYYKFRAIQKEHRELKEHAGQNQSDLDYYSFQLKQLDEARLVTGEEDELKSEHEMLTHAGEIHDALEGAALVIGGEELSVLNHLVDVRRKLERIAAVYTPAEELLSRLGAVIIEINDMGNEMAGLAGGIESDPSRLQLVEERLDLIYSLLQKHRVDRVSDLITIRDQLKLKVEGLSLGDERLEELERLLDESVNHLSGMASMISTNRKEIVEDVEKEMITLLQQLGMPNARFVVDISTLDVFGPRGKDHAEFLFTANRQTSPENIGKVASGGELSRVMLSLKSLQSDNRNMPTIFFDEIDAGVSGEIATRVGEILSSMGQKMQVINITHLPQVAALGSTHYHVYKEDDGKSTITRIKLLSKEERLKEIARLLSGTEITRASMENARELMGGASA